MEMRNFCRLIALPMRTLTSVLQLLKKNKTQLCEKGRGGSLYMTLVFPKPGSNTCLKQHKMNCAPDLPSEGTLGNFVAVLSGHAKLGVQLGPGKVQVD